MPVATAVTARVGDALLGTRVGERYRVERVLSRGGMGVVYAALYEQQQREVALKVLDERSATQPEAVARFLREAATGSSLWHGHVVGVSDFGRLPDGRPYLVMPRIPGKDLSETLLEEGPVPPRRAAALLAGVASALDALHAEGLVHRDLKPENVMHVRDDAGHETTLLLDFGIAAQSPVPALSDTDLLLGTPEFMAPEALAGESVDHRADLYSLACVAFELICGKLPFEETDVQALSSAHATGRARTLGEAAGRPFPAPIEEVLAQGLAKDPASRPSTARAFVNELARAAAEAPEEEAEAPAVRAVRKSRAPTLVGRAGPIEIPAIDPLPVEPLPIEALPIEAAPIEAAPIEAAPAEAASVEAPPIEAAPIEAPPIEAPPPAPAHPAEFALASRSLRSDFDSLQPPLVLDAEIAALAPRRDLGRKLAYACAAALPVGLFMLWGTGSEPAPPVPAQGPPPAAASRPSTPLPATLAAAPAASAEVAEVPTPVERTASVSSAATPDPAEHAAPPPTAARPRARVARRAAARAQSSSAAPELTQRATDALLGGDFDAARTAFREALAADPRHAPAWRGLGLLLERAGERADAARALRRYLKLRPQAPDAERIRARLDALANANPGSSR